MSSPTANSESPAPTSRNHIYLILLILVIATLLKLQWAQSSAGSIDTVLLHSYGKALDTMSLQELYARTSMFNNTPLSGMGLLALYRAGDGDPLRFSFYLRLTSILTDIAVVLGVLALRSRLGAPPWWALALFAASPVSLMISGFHTNIDPIMVGFLFFAVAAAVWDRPWQSAIYFALACNVKIVPIPMGPILFFYWLHRGRGWTFLGIVGFIHLLCSLPPLVQDPGLLYHNVYAYGSLWGAWGIPYLLRFIFPGWASIQAVALVDNSPACQAIGLGLKLIIVGGIGALAWRRRRLEALQLFATFAGAWAIFFIFAPGIGVQYMIWFAPFVVLAAPRWYALLTLLATGFLAVFYQLSSQRPGFPWYFCVPRGPEQPIWSACAFPLWLAFVVYLALSAKNLWCLPEQK